MYKPLVPPTTTLLRAFTWIAVKASKVHALVGWIAEWISQGDKVHDLQE